MSMSQANAALMLDVYAETARLGITLTQAERMVDQAAQRMGKKLDTSFGDMGNKITKMLSAAVGAGFAIKVVDDALRKLAEGIREGGGAKAIGEAIGNSIVESIRNAPIAGALMEVSSAVGNLALGDPLGDEAARANTRRVMEEMQRQREAGPGFERELRMAGATGAEREALEREQELARLTAIGQRAKAGRVEVYSDGREEDFGTGLIESVQNAIDTAMKAFDDRIAQRRAQEAERILKERTQAEEQLRREQERAAQQAKRDEEQRLREQEEAYTTFIQGNALDAIAAIEAQLSALTATQRPTREQRLAGIMDTMDFGIGTAGTALGAFTFAQGDATEISRSILHNAEQQLATLERIEALQEQANRIAEEAGLR